VPAGFVSLHGEEFLNVLKTKFGLESTLGTPPTES